MQFLTKEQILAADDMRFESIEVPEWGGWLRIKTLTGEERDAFEEEMIRGRTDDETLNLKNLRAKLVARCAVDESGKLIFSEKDIHSLGQKSGAALEIAFAACQKLNRLRRADVEELTKNLKKGQSDDSTSD